MKVFVTRSSGWIKDGEVREYESLDDCVKTMLETEDFDKWAPELIVSKIDSLVPDIAKDCEYQIEIYDSWRE